VRRGLPFLALLAACAPDTVGVRVRLSLDATSCGLGTDPSGGMMVGGPADISLACGVSVGQKVLGEMGATVHEECEDVSTASAAGTATSLADLPTVLEGFRSPELSEGTTIRVRLDIVRHDDSMTGMGTGVSCSSPFPDGTTGMGPAILGESADVRLGGSTSVIDVPLSCVAPPICP
jgi:hypothetical protein